MRTVGSQIVPARVNELRRVLLDLSTDDMSQLDEVLGASMDRSFGRELMATRLPVSDSTYICLYNLEPSGVIVLHRSTIAARIRALVISPDQRRKGLARTMLVDAERRVQERNLDWLWMTIPSSNTPATRCALSCGYKRYRPQFLRRGVGRAMVIETRSVYLQPVKTSDAAKFIAHWYGVELYHGDLWAQPLVETELLPDLFPEVGPVWSCMVEGREAGCAHRMGPDYHPIISLWLEPAIWNTPDEMALLRAVLGTLEELPPVIDLWLGSGDHLRASLARYKSLGFQPVLSERVIFAKHLLPKQDD